MLCSDEEKLYYAPSQETIGGMGSCEGRPRNWSPLFEAMPIISES